MQDRKFLLLTSLLALSFLAVGSRVSTARPAPFGGPPCFGVLTVEQGTPHLSCLNDSCVVTCGRKRVFTSQGDGWTCACAGVTPGCCHLVVLDSGTFFSEGECADQDQACAAGTECLTRINILGTNYYEAYAYCLPSTD